MTYPIDLVVLVADRDMQAGFESLLRRHPELGSRPFSFRILRHPERDPGVYLRCHDFLRDYQRIFARALVVFDRQGSGAESYPAEALERRVERRLGRNGWAERCAAVVLDPELESWIWADSPVLAGHLGISRSELRGILAQEGKPVDPKGELEKIWKARKIRHTSTFYGILAQELDFRNCRDRAFRKLLHTLQTWFPREGV